MKKSFILLIGLLMFLVSGCTIQPMDLGRDDAPIIKTTQEINYNFPSGMQMQNEPSVNYANDGCTNSYSTRCVQQQVRRIDNCNTSCCSTRCERQIRESRCVHNSCGYTNLRSYY